MCVEMLTWHRGCLAACLTFVVRLEHIHDLTCQLGWGTGGSEICVGMNGMMAWEFEMCASGCLAPHEVFASLRIVNSMEVE